MSSPNASRQLPTAMSMLLLFVSASVVSGLVLMGYLYVARRQGQAAPTLLSVYVPIALLAPVPILAIGARAVAKVRARLQAALDQGAGPADLPVDDVRYFLRMHRWFIAAKTSFWTTFSLGWPVLTYSLGVERGYVELIDATAGIGLGITTGVCVYYAFDMLSRRRIAPLLLADTLEHLRPFPPFRIWQHLGLLVLTLGVVQPLTILVLRFQMGSSLAGDIYLIVFFLVVAAFQVSGIVAAVTIPAGRFDSRMARVRDGDLSARADVIALDTFGRLGSTFNLMVEGLEQRERMRELFGRYVTTQVAEEILEGRVHLGGERRHATVLFSDIRGFTAMSEHLSPEEVVTFLNRYFEEMIDCVLEHGGTIDKFIGDAVMALFGLPTSLGPDNDAKCAASCALEMIERLEKLNHERETRGETPIDIGIALHSGELVAGAIGSTKRMEYTVIGDTVNLTSRLEGLTKRLGRRVVLSSDTAALIEDSYSVERLDAVPVRGRTEAVDVFALEARKSSSSAQSEA